MGSCDSACFETHVATPKHVGFYFDDTGCQLETTLYPSSPHQLLVTLLFDGCCLLNFHHLTIPALCTRPAIGGSIFAFAANFVLLRSASQAQEP
jgi:hypothetical protein